MRCDIIASSLALAISGGAAPLEAQTTASVTPKNATLDAAAGSIGYQKGESAQVEEIVVTGTRLSPSGLNLPTPVTVIGANLVQQRAGSNLADTLTELPAVRTRKSKGAACRRLLKSDAPVAQKV